MAAASPDARRRPVLVTGAASGIGRATALSLAAAGHPVGLSDVDEEAALAAAAEVTANGGCAVGLWLDVTSTESVEKGVEQAARALAGLGGLVNNAGWTEHRALTEQDDEYVSRTLEINLSGAIRVTRAALPHLREWGSGRIVNIASDAARGGMSDAAAYSAAKGGVLALTRSLALELAEQTITVNTVSPGVIDTPLLAKTMPEGEPARDRLARRIPMRRLGRPEEVAHCVRFFCSEEAAYTTGQLLSCNGGIVVT